MKNYQTSEAQKRLKSPLSVARSSKEKTPSRQQRMESKDQQRKAQEEKLKAERAKRERTYDQRIKLFKD